MSSVQLDHTDIANGSSLPSMLLAPYYSLKGPNNCTGTKVGGQALLGGLDCTVHRNFFGAQVRSFVTKLKAPACMKDFGPELDDFRAVFIR